MAKGVWVPSQLKLNKIKDDREFEWLLCLASILQASQRLQPTKVGEAQPPSPAPDLRIKRPRQLLRYNSG
jgi:hypothetical protein